MLIKRIVGAFLITAVVATSAFAGDCQSVKGKESVVNNGNGTTSGTITEGGKLNGTTQTVFTSAFTPTPEPSTFSFTDDLTLTTNKGVLRTHNVTLFDAATGLFTALARIDANTSTGEFAGATGVLYISGKTADGGATFEGEITGSMCFADWPLEAWGQYHIAVAGGSTSQMQMVVINCDVDPSATVMWYWPHEKFCANSNPNKGE